LSEREQKVVSEEKVRQTLSVSTPETQKNDNKFGIGGIIAPVVGVSVLIIGGIIAIKKKLSKKNKG